MSRYKIITKEKQVDELIAHCKKTGYCSFDFETTGLKYQNDEEYPLILGVSFQPGISWIIPLGHSDSPFKNNWEKIFRKFGREVLEDWDIVKVAWNFKFEYKWCLRYDIIPKGRLFDAMLAKYCLDEERPHGLKEFVRNFFEKYAGYEEDIKAQDTGENLDVDWKRTDYKKLCKYCGIDSDLTLRAMIIMEPKLIKGGFYNLFRNLLSGILRVLAESEYRGTLIDRPYLEGLMKTYEVYITEADKKLRNTPSLLKYERRKNRRNLKRLIKEVRKEIKILRKEDKPTTPRKIANREAKIKGFLEGKFNRHELRKMGDINFKSPAQLVDFLFKPPYGSKYGLMLTPRIFTQDKKTKKYTDNPSTGEDVLEEFKKKDKTGFMENLLKFRELEKLDSTYIRGMHPNLDTDDRVHTNFKINGTVTGRLSSVEPNLQNIPRDTTASDIKKMFIVPPGFVLLEVDYSQAELRIIAERSEDRTMIEIFKKNHNIHVATACKMFKGEYDEVKSILKNDKHPDWLKWEKQKKTAKSMNFSIVYQQGDKATAEQMDISLAKAKKFKDSWYAQFPGVVKWLKKQKREAHENEYVRNMWGRKRRLYDINDGRPGVRAESERQAINAPVQGDSGDFTLFSQTVIRREILKGELPRDLIHLYTVHDSIGYAIRPALIHKVVPKLIKICDNPETERYFGFKLKHVGMKVSAEAGINWGSIKEYDPWTDYSKLLIKS